ncbi:MAG: GNAT family N-acetyltransferase, partial [Bacteroidetes bacterium]
TPTDLALVYDLYFLPETNPYLLYEPMTMQAFAPIFNQMLAQGIKFLYEVNDEAMGMVKLLPLSHRTSHVLYIGGLAIHPRYSGKGHGLAMLEAIKTWAKTRGFTRLELDVDEDNAVAKNLYTKAGFVVEGVLRKYAFRHTVQQYFDNYRMAYLL